MVIDSREMMKQAREEFALALNAQHKQILICCLLYTSDAADE